MEVLSNLALRLHSHLSVSLCLSYVHTHTHSLYISLPLSMPKLLVQKGINFLFCKFHNILKSACYFSFAVVMDIIFSWKARHTMSYSHKLRHGVKLLAACIWTATLPASYNISKKYPVCSAKNVIGRLCLSQYMVVVAVYLTTNVIGMALFLVPAVRRYIETSNFCVCKILSWWCQVTDFSPILFLSPNQTY